jgi:signal transduction histidine kinase
LIAIRLVMMGTRFATLLFPELSLEASLRIEFLTIYLSLPVFSTFIYYLYPAEFSLRILKLIVLLSLVLSLAVIPFKETVYNFTLVLFEGLATLTLGYACYVLIRAIRQFREGAGIIFCGFLFLALTAVNDILYEKELIATGVYLPIGLLGYIFFQAMHLSHRSTWNLNRNEELSRQLAHVNVTLEHRVKQRTAELKKRNEQLNIEINDHKKTAKKLADAKLLAEAANQAKSEFLANMSHELRTPMHGILGFAKFGEDRIDRAGRDSLLDYFREIKSCGERLLILLNDLLDLSKLESGKIIYEFQQNTLSSVVETVLKEFDALAKGKNIGFNFRKPAYSTEGIFDEGKMIQVVRNLVSNAIKYSPENSMIDIQIVNQDDSLSLSVIDRGVGIPENELKEVFDKFVQSSKTKTAAGGTGLGLPISQKIIVDHRGDIWAKNNTDGGATFTFIIPKFQKTKKKLGEILVEQKLITKEDLINSLKSQQEE